MVDHVRAHEAGSPPIGEFRDGVSTFLDQEAYEGRSILMRQFWSKFTPDSIHFEQAFSADFSKTLEARFIANLTRLKG